MFNSQLFTDWAKAFGFSEVGFCLPDDFQFSWRIVQAQATVAERKQLRFSPMEDYPQCRSIAVLLWPYPPADYGTKDAVFVDSYYKASNAAYHAARALEERLQQTGRFAKANVAYPAKEAALRCGMGIIGQNSLLITPSYGSRVVIILMATDIEVNESVSAIAPDSCLNCGRCIQSCPTGALDENGMSHPERCLRNFMMEGIVIPEHLRAKIGMSLIGCDICQRVCPMQPQGVRDADPLRYSLRDFVTDDSRAFSETIERLACAIGRNTARPQRVRAQAAILAGNSRDRKFLPVLHEWAELPFEAVREHARWAIKEIESDIGGLDHQNDTE